MAGDTALLACTYLCPRSADTAPPPHHHRATPLMATTAAGGAGASRRAGGNGSDGQLGYGGSDGLSEPRTLDFFRGRHVKGVACGNKHTLVLAESGAVYAFGCNDHGQLGHSKRQLRPETIDYLEAFRIVQVACGSRHSVALTDDGQVLAWGGSDRGQVGLGLDSVAAGSVSKPRFVRFQPSRRIVQVRGHRRGRRPSCNVRALMMG